jgi:hypothetical protein
MCSAEDKAKTHQEKCQTCKGAGIIKYKELDEFTFRQWVPWQTKPCPMGCKASRNKGTLVKTCLAEMMHADKIRSTLSDTADG